MSLHSARSFVVISSGKVHFTVKSHKFDISTLTLKSDVAEKYCGNSNQKALTMDSQKNNKTNAPFIKCSESEYKELRKENDGLRVENNKLRKQINELLDIMDLLQTAYDIHTNTSTQNGYSKMNALLFSSFFRTFVDFCLLLCCSTNFSLFSSTNHHC